MSQRYYLPSTRICNTCVLNRDANTWCATCPRRPLNQGLPVNYPIWPFSATDYAVTLAIILGCTRFTIENLWIGGAVSLLMVLAVLRTAIGIYHAGRKGIRPTDWQKFWTFLRSLWESIVLAAVAFIFAVGGVFFTALAAEWIDMPDFAQMSGFLGWILGGVLAPCLVIAMYLRGLPNAVTAPINAPSISTWIVGLISILSVNLLAATAAVLGISVWPFWGVIATLAVLPPLVWGTWGAVLELRSDFIVSPVRMITLLVRGIGVLVESLLIGGTLAAAGMLFTVVSNAVVTGSFLRELAFWSGCGFASVAGPAVAFAWWWRKRPKLLVDLTQELEATIVTGPLEVATPEVKKTETFIAHHGKKKKKQRKRDRDSQQKMIPQEVRVSSAESSASKVPANRPTKK